MTEQFRETLIEAMASAMCIAAGRNPDRQLFYSGKLEWTLLIPHATNALDAMLATLPSLGLALVPVEATEAQTYQGALSRVADDPRVHPTWPRGAITVVHDHDHWRKIYAAMLAAPPSPLGGGE